MKYLAFLIIVLVFISPAIFMFFMNITKGVNYTWWQITIAVLLFITAFGVKIK